MLQPQKLLPAFVKFVVPYGVQFQPQPVHRLNGVLIMKQRRNQRAGSDQVARGDDNVVRILRFSVA